METLTYALGRECQLSIEGMLISSAQDVSVREMVGEIDATAFQSPVQSSIAIHRTYEIQVTIADIEIASIVSSYRTQKSGIFTVPGIVNISLSSGLFDINTTFTIGDIEADEPLDGVVLPRLTFRQWGTSY